MHTKQLLVKRPSAWIPLVMSFSAILLVVGYIILFGVTQKPQNDEGPAVRIFQLLIAGQVPVIAYFVMRWLAKKRNEVLRILVFQILAALLAVALVFFLEL